MRAIHALAGLGLAALAALSVVACESPIQDDLIDSLGEENPNIPQGEYHRYGQPCLACHGGYGEGPEWAVAGTIFATPSDDITTSAVITITDATGEQKLAPANCAGNFYIKEETWQPVFPLHVEIECTLPDGTKKRAVMGTRINRDGSCASCHEKGPATSTSPGQVYCVPDQPDPPFEVDPSCPGGPGAG
ncbi:MAG: hypothetical protein U0271_00155 [Polyangiaceae bacterium]